MLVIVLLVIIVVAGGPAGSANTSGLKLHVSETGVDSEVQKININRAEVWLLEALPGVGPILAQRIVDYRQQNGAFNHTSELLEIDGIGTAIYERIKPLITVGCN